MAFSKKALRARGAVRKQQRSGSGGYGDVLRQGELAWGGGMSRDSNPQPQDGEGMYSERLYALCNDGTIWRRYFDRHRGVSTWQRIPSPLDEDEL